MKSKKVGIAGLHEGAYHPTRLGSIPDMSKKHKDSKPLIFINFSIGKKEVK